ncbi:helix-turn-helix domain-containing protein [Nocardia brasiliensis]|uniref:helix-turn-helix domain-containing protein n=1 Tax=Nocardia brasiliensis TaxID=37326 RepID=UPI0024544C48|nr:helix-turn-helix transcriptional regulator [Nocardia brasiliensis]
MVDPNNITTRIELAAAIAGLLDRGSRSYQAVAADAQLGVATVYDMANGKSFPRWTSLKRLLNACGITGPDLTAWRDAHRRVQTDNSEPPQPLIPAHPVTTPATTPTPNRKIPHQLFAASVLGVVVIVVLVFIVLTNRDKNGAPSGAGASQPTTTSDTIAAIPFTWQSVLSDKIAGFMFAQPVSGLGPPPQVGNRTEFQEWARTHQGVPSFVTGNDQGTVTATNGIQLGLSVKGPGSVVMLTGMDIEIVERKPAMSGTHVGMLVGGRMVGRRVELDADTDPPTLIESSSGEENANGEPLSEPLQFPYRISATDPELFYVWVRTTQHITWRIKIRWIAESHSGETTIDDHGKPFEVAMPATTATTCTVGEFPPKTAWQC